MTKLLATTTLLLTLLVSPLMAEEKVMKCYPFAGKDWEDYGFEANYYKLEKKLFGNDKVLIRVGTKWKPFCRTKNKTLSSDLIWSQKKKKSYKNVRIEMGDNAISCFFTKTFKVEYPNEYKKLLRANGPMKYKDYKELNGEFDIFAPDYKTLEKRYSLVIDFDRSLTEFSESKYFDKDKIYHREYKQLYLARKEGCN